MEVKKIIFLSRCSKEFENECKEIHHHYSVSEEYQVIDQTGIDGNNATLDIQCDTLKELQERISKSYAVIHLIGDETGTQVGDDQLQKFLNEAGNWLNEKESAICQTLETSKDVWENLTYTQWEAYIALHFNIPLICYDLRGKNDTRRTLQHKHLNRLHHAGGIHPTKCDRTDLVRIIRARLERPLNSGNISTKIARITLNDPCLPACLDITGAIDFVGRVDDLSSLDTYLKEAGKNKTRVIQIVAQGGTGKTKLVARWIHSRRLAASEEENHSHITILPSTLLEYFKAGSVLGYSLYSQGTNKLDGSGNAAVGTPIWSWTQKWFQDAEHIQKIDKYRSSSPEKKAEKLAEILTTRKRSTILILDGLEAALTRIKGDDGNPEWITHDIFLKNFFKYFLSDNSNKCIVIITTRVKITDLECEKNVVTHELAPLYFKEKNYNENKTSYTYIEDEKKDEAASLLYYYYKGRDSETARVLTAASAGETLKGKNAEIIRKELLRSVDVEIPSDDSVLLHNLRDIANKLRGHTLSLKLAGQLVAKGTSSGYTWQYLAQNFGPMGHKCKLSRSTREDDFSSTVRRVNMLLDPHIKIFQKGKQYAALNALLSVGVFDRPASFEEITHAAKYLADLECCPVGQSDPVALQEALNELSIDGFLFLPEKEDEQQEWDCHPLMRAYLCNYIFDRNDNELKACKCHHQVACFYIEKLSKTWKEPVQTFLEELAEDSEKGHWEDFNEKNTKKEEKRKKRKEKWENLKGNNRDQAFKDMELLQRAVYHFILAKELRNAWHLYWELISIQKEYLLSRFFGKFEDDLSTLNYFFESPWSSIKNAKEENQKLSPSDIASLFDAAGFRLRSLNRLTEAHQASGGSFLDWNKAGWSPHGTISEKKKKKTLLEGSYAAGNRAEYSMVQASLADALMYANLAVHLADESGDSKARFVHRVELSEILWQRGDTEQAIELLEWVNCESNIPFPEDNDSSILPRKWAEFYCLYRYRYGKILVSQGDLKEAQYMANTLHDDLERINWKWLLNIGLYHLLKGHIKLAEAKPSWIITPSIECSPSNISFNLDEGREDFKKALEKFNEIHAGHHELKARLGRILCEHGSGEKNLPDTREELSGKSGISKIAGERHLFRIDAEVAKAIIYKHGLTTGETSSEDIKNQVDRAKNMCIASGYLRHLPFLDSLHPKEG